MGPSSNFISIVQMLEETGAQLLTNCSGEFSDVTFVSYHSHRGGFLVVQLLLDSVCSSAKPHRTHWLSWWNHFISIGLVGSLG